MQLPYNGDRVPCVKQHDSFFKKVVRKKLLHYLCSTKLVVLRVLISWALRPFIVPYVTIVA